MDRERISSKQSKGRGDVDPDEVQDRLVNSTYVHHDHGGREHGHDWDDWLKADRALKSESGKKKRAHSKPPKLWV